MKKLFYFCAVASILLVSNFRFTEASLLPAYNSIMNKNSDTGSASQCSSLPTGSSLEAIMECASSDSVTRAYNECLGRDPDQEGYEFHKNLIKSGQKTADQIYNDICNSEEAKNKDEAGAESQSPSETFLWKPKSDSDGKLVVLLPSSMRGQVVSVSVMKNGQSIETGTFSGDEHNGMRPHFRFSKPGADYGKDIELVSAGASGMCSFKIPDGAKRTEGVTPNCGAGVGMGAGFGGAGYAGGFVYDPGTGGTDVEEYLSSLAGGAGKNACFDRGQTDGTERITTSGKCFSTVSNKPFFPVADTAWQIFRLSPNDLDTYIKTRKSQGFNVIKFVGVGFGGTFEQYDLVFKKLEENKMYAEVMLDSSQYDKSISFVNRYKNKSNLFLWVVWGLDNRRTEAEVVALMRGVKANDSTHLITAHPKGKSSTSSLSSVNPLSPIYYVHSYAVGSAESLIKAAVSRGDKPVYQGEPAYDGSRNGAANVKSEVEKSFNAGAAGISYGHDNIWQGCSAAGQKTTVTGVTYTCNNSVLKSLNTVATAWIQSVFVPKVNTQVSTQSTSTVTTTNDTDLATSDSLSISCEISDRSIEVGEDTEISVDISGGTSPYKVRWNGDTSNIRKISKTKNEQDIEFKKAGKYVLEVKVTDDEDEEVEEICSAINVYEKDAEPEEEASTEPTPIYETQTFTFYRDLTVGSEGADVSALQDYLIARGFLSMPAGVAKGYFGALTQSAVAKWQAAVGLTPAAGYFGQKSRTYISTGVIPASAPTSTYVAPVTTTPTKPAVSAASCVNVTKTLTYEQSNSDVSKVQDFLEMKGYLTMPEGVAKGTYGKLTATAIANYMATKGISTSGRVADESVLSQIRKDTGCVY